MSTPSQKRAATVEDFLAIPEEERFHELIDGQLVRKADPSGEHGGAEIGIGVAIGPFFQRPPGRGGPGGWWFASETEVRLASGEIVRPDVLGWRRERAPSRPRGFPVEMLPDWICEILSPSEREPRHRHEAAHGSSRRRPVLLAPRSARLDPHGDALGGGRIHDSARGKA